MAIDVLGIEEEDRNRIAGIYGQYHQALDQAKLHVNDMPPEEGNLIRRTVSQMSNISTSIPHASDKSLKGRVTLGPVETRTAEQIGLDESQEEVDPELLMKAVEIDPNLAWEAVKLGLAKEQHTNRQLNELIKEAKELQKKIDLLLDFSAELTGQKDDTNELSEKAKTIMADLKKLGVELWKGEDQAINKEKLSELKALSGSHVDKLRSELQVKINTEIQPKMQDIASIMSMLQEIIRSHRKLIDKALQLSTGRG